MTRLSVAAFLTSALLAAGCFPKTGPAPGPLSESTLQLAQSRQPQVTAETLESGRQVFLKTCEGCHGYPDIGAYPEAQWPEIAREMGDKAELSAAETELLLNFVLAVRAGQPAAPAK